MNKTNYSTRDIVLIAMYGSLFMAVEYIQNALNLFKMPNGGSLGLSSIILLLASYQMGYKKGLVVSLISVPLQFLTGQMYLEGGFLGFFLDYVFAFGIYGIASIFPSSKYIYSGVIFTNLVRFVSHTLAGTLVWGLPLGPSAIYNGPYMLATAVVGFIFVPLINERLKKQV